MLTFRTILLLLWTTGCLLPAQSEAQVTAALERWHARYVAAAIELGEPALRGAKSRDIYRRLLPDALENVDHFHGLQWLLSRAVEQQTLEQMHALLELATVGELDDVIEPARRPAVVRMSAHGTLGRFTATLPLHDLMRIASGERAAWPRTWHAGLQAGALRALGATELAVARPIIERACADAEPAVRSAAAEVLRALGSPRSLRCVCDALDREGSPLVLQRLLAAARAILHRHLDTCDTALVRRAVLAACAHLGGGDWRADLAAVELLRDFRSEAAVEPLIRVLESFGDSRAAIDSGRLSGVLRHAVHETLQDLTGARFGALDAAQWREFWERERTGFTLAPPRDRSAGVTSAGFFGIPIVGTRVVFVIDRSGSMTAAYAPSGAQHDRSIAAAGSRYEHANDELLRAAQALPADARFQVVMFASEVERWRRDFVEPLPANISALGDYVGGRRPEGATNIHDALMLALSLGAQRTGERYESPVDEIFLLSDGVPTAGPVVDPGLLTSLIQEANRGRRVRVHTVFLGDPVDAQFMRDLAAQNEGTFVQL